MHVCEGDKCDTDIIRNGIKPFGSHYAHYYNTFQEIWDICIAVIGAQRSDNWGEWQWYTNYAPFVPVSNMLMQNRIKTLHRRRSEIEIKFPAPGDSRV